MKPLISIITPAYNAEKYITETLNSVKFQSYSNWEHLIVIDTKTTDQTKTIVQRYADKDPRIQIILDPQAQGVAENRNLAIRHAKGEFLAFLDADDVWHTRKLDQQLHFMLSKQVSFSFHSYQRIQQDGRPLRSIRHAPQTVTYNELLNSNVIGCLTVMLKKDNFKNISFKQESHEDFGLWLDLLKTQDAAYGMPENLASYRIVQNSLSDNKLKAAVRRWKMLRDREHLGLLRSVYHFAYYGLSALRIRF